MTKKAFLIQHIGLGDSEARQRADRILDTIVRPACTQSGFTCDRADHFPKELIVEPIVSALHSSSLVIADLGLPPWNQNVLMEIGFRMAIGRPIVFLSDVEPNPKSLPVHLLNRRILTIAEPEITIENLCDYINEQKNTGSGWKSHYPTIEFSCPQEGDKPPYFTFANEAAAKFYGADSVEQLLSMTVDEADERLKSYMCRPQATAFAKEQDRLFGAATRNRKVTAQVPAWFTNHRFPDEFNYKPYWPVLLLQKFSPHDDKSLVMRVAFIDLKEWSGNRQPDPDLSIKFPRHFRHRNFQYDLFLSHNSADKETVRELANAFTRMNLRVWVDEHDLVGRGSLYAELLKAMYESRIIVIVVGPSGLGKWQESELRSELFDAIMNDRPIALLLLDSVRTDDDAWIKSLPVEYRVPFQDVLYAKLPPLEVLKKLEQGGLSFIERILKLFADTFRQLDKEEEQDA